MPRSIRFFPVNHDINADPEVWELTDKFGDRALRVWLEVLSIADRNKGEIPGKWEGYASVLAGRTKSTTRHLQGVLQWLTRWLDIDSEGTARVRNYAKYHKVRGENSSPPNLTYPNLTKPIKNIAQSQKDSGSMRMMNLEFPDDWKWLEEFIKRNPLNNNFPTDRFLDFAWWDAVSYRCGGLSQDFVEREFAGIRRWIMDNPGREPTPRGYRKFVAGWLERAYEKERRFNPNGKKA